MHAPGVMPSQAEIDAVDFGDWRTFRDLIDMLSSPSGNTNPLDLFLRERLSFTQLFYLYMFG